MLIIDKKQIVFEDFNYNNISINKVKLEYT